jgi:hypothetical protein
MTGPPLFFSDAARFYAAGVLSLGVRTGLLDALFDGGSAEDLARRCGTDGQGARVWADAMVPSGCARLADGRYSSIEEAVGGLRGDLEGLKAVVAALASMGALMPAIESSRPQRFVQYAGVGRGRALAKAAGVGEPSADLAAPRWRLKEWLSRIRHGKKSLESIRTKRRGESGPGHSPGRSLWETCPTPISGPTAMWLPEGLP